MQNCVDSERKCNGTSLKVRESNIMTNFYPLLFAVYYEEPKGKRPFNANVQQN